MSPGKQSFSIAIMAALVVASFASVALADEHDAVFEDGSYVLVIPGVGDFRFEVEAEGAETVTAIAAPDGYEVDDDDPNKAAWKNAASLEVEMKLDKVEGNVTWGDSGQATLDMPRGSITVTEPDRNGHYTVTADGDWTAFGDGSDWMVANNNIEDATKFFKVEATSEGVGVKLVSEPGDGFLNDIEEEEESEVEDDGAEGQGQGQGNGG